MSAEHRISISETRRVAGELPDGKARDALLMLIDSAEALRRIHEDDCGCDRPGDFTICAWPPPDGGLLARFDFDEEVEWP